MLVSEVEGLKKWRALTRSDGILFVRGGVGKEVD